MDLFQQIDPSQREAALLVLATLRYAQDAQPEAAPRELTPYEQYEQSKEQ